MKAFPACSALLLVLPLLGVLAACGSSSSSSDTASTATSRGKVVADKNVCASCHGADFAGGDSVTKGTPNITSDKDHGIGGWTDEQIKTAVTTGVDDEGETLCASMQRYKLSDADLDDLVAYLRSVPPSTKNNPTKCTQ